MTTVRKWGNSLGVRIPRDLAADVGLGEGQEVKLEKRDGALAVRPVKKKRPSVDTLIARITPENLNIDHEWIDAPPVGKEIL